MSKYEWGGVESVSAYHERERLCPEGVRVREIAHVHYAPPPLKVVRCVVPWRAPPPPCNGRQICP